jgi:FkbM family methyltransferase
MGLRPREVFMGYLSTIKYIHRHPLCRSRLAAQVRYFKTKLFFGLHGRKRSISFDWIDTSQLNGSATRTSIIANSYVGLHEYNEMGFLLHYLRPNNVFVDIGANAGSFTVLAGKVAGCTVWAFEPVPDAFENLMQNIQTNNLGPLVSAKRIAIGEKEVASIVITTDLDCRNHIVEGENDNAHRIRVPMKTLDSLIAGKSLVLKIDVEGYEGSVLSGARGLFKRGNVDAVIVEANAKTPQFHGQLDVQRFLLQHGFTRVNYDPKQRSLIKARNGGRGGRNHIYVRDLSAAKARTIESRRFFIRPVGVTI